MKRTMIGLALTCVLVLCTATSASAAFGLEGYDVDFRTAAGQSEAQAGAHPYEMEIGFSLVYDEKGAGEYELVPLKNASFEQLTGFVGNATAIPQCTTQRFASPRSSDGQDSGDCPDQAAVGYGKFELNVPKESLLSTPVYNLEPAPGVVAALGVVVFGERVQIDVTVSDQYPYNLVARVTNTPQAVRFFGSKLVLWGVPGDPVHDLQRGNCFESGFPCTGSGSTTPFLTLPRTCGSHLASTFDAESWGTPTAFASGVEETVSTFEGCAQLGFSPETSARPTTNEASSPSGLEFGIEAPTDGLTSKNGYADSDIKRTEAVLPEGVAINPSLATGLGACSQAQLDEEGPDGSAAGGCPESSKIGSVEVKTPLLAEPLGGDVYAAAPFDNEFGSLFGAFMVVRNADRGIAIRQQIEITPDPETGRLTAIADRIPQLPFANLSLSFRGGPRGPLTTPAECGSRQLRTTLTPWSGAPAVQGTSSIEVSSGRGGTACAPEGAKPFRPAMEAGTVAPLAGTHSPFVFRVSRDADSPRIRSVETLLPKGLLGKLAGVEQCSEAGIRAAEGRRNPNEGKAEIASPSCPAASQVGVVKAGAGSGTPTQVEGRAYLAGPYKGAPLSLVIVTPAVVGPFDLGTVVVRTALHVDLVTAQIRAVSDPVPSILQGVPLDLRSISVELDRPDFTLNPTSCAPMEVQGGVSSLLGQSASLSERFQVGGCKGLDFKPQLRLKLSGATKRSGHPALKAILTFPKVSNANIASAQVTLPRAEFLDQGSIGSVCKQADLKAGTCPASAIYGRAKAWSPLLDRPLEGPVYLGVGYGHKLPDLVADLNGQIRVLVNGEVDTGKGGGLRNTFHTVPDAPVSRFVLELKGGKKKGLLENSTNICRDTQKADVKFVGQNGKVESYRQKLEKRCGKSGR